MKNVKLIMLALIVAWQSGCAGSLEQHRSISVAQRRDVAMRIGVPEPVRDDAQCRSYANVELAGWYVGVGSSAIVAGAGVGVSQTTGTAQTVLGGAMVAGAIGAATGFYLQNAGKARWAEECSMQVPQ